MRAKSVEKARRKLCPICFDDSRISPVIEDDTGYTCVVCGHVDYCVREPYENAERRKMTQTAIDLAEQRAVVVFKQQQIEAASNDILASMVIPAEITDPIEKEAAARVLAELKVAYGLNPLTGEMYLAKFDGNKYVVAIGYQGYGKIARRQDLKTGKTHVIGKHVVSSEADIKRAMADVCTVCLGRGTCRKCNGTGKFRDTDKPCFSCDGGKCRKCGGEGRVSVNDICRVEVPLYIVEDKLACDKAGIPYQPTIGVAVWQMGDNIARTKDPVWQTRKNAIKDAYRQMYSLDELPIAGATVQIVDQEDFHVEVYDSEMSSLIEAIELSGVPVTNDLKFIDFMQAAVKSGVCNSQLDVLSAFQELELSFNEDNEYTLKIIIDAYFKGAYPLSPKTFTGGYKYAYHLVEAEVSDAEEIANKLGVDMGKDMSMVAANAIVAVNHGVTVKAAQEAIKNNEFIDWR